MYIDLTIESIFYIHNGRVKYYFCSLIVVPGSTFVCVDSVPK